MVVVELVILTKELEELEEEQMAQLAETIVEQQILVVVVLGEI